MKIKRNPNQITIVTSFSEKGYKNYGKAFLEGFIKNFPKEVTLNCFHHSEYGAKELWVPNDFPMDSRIAYVNLDLIPELIPFKDNVANQFEKLLGLRYKSHQVPWRLDAIKFTNKVFALAAANSHHDKNTSVGWLVWVDADTVAKKPLTFNRLKSWLPKDADIVHLGRKAAAYSETSFIGFNLCRPTAAKFIDSLIGTFLSGEFMHYQEWHDGFIFERLLNLYKQHGLVAHNLSQDCPILEAFMSSELGLFMDHFKGNLKQGEHPAPQLQGPASGRAVFKVNAYDCVDHDEIRSNILTNFEKIKKWVSYGKPVDGKDLAIFCSAGPSLKADLPKIKQMLQDKPDTPVFCVKHAYPVLMQAGIEPDFCVVLDPRPIDGISTHGVKRKDLFEVISPKTVFLVASMTHPTVVDYLQSKGASILGWNAFVEEFARINSEITENRSEVEKYLISIPTGTCAATRGLSLARVMGIKEFDMFGFDCSLESKPEVMDKSKHVQVSLLPTSTEPHVILDPNVPQHNDETFFYSTGELVSMYQDMMGCMSNLEFSEKMKFNIHSPTTTLLGKGWAIKTNLESEAIKHTEKLEQEGLTLAEVFEKAKVISIKDCFSKPEV